MAELLDIFGFLSVLLRGLTLAFEALSVGGLIFIFGIARERAHEGVRGRLGRAVTTSACALAAIQLCYVAANASILTGSTDLRWSDVADAGFVTAGALTVSGAITIALLARSHRAGVLCALACVPVIVGSVMASHSVARLEHRASLAVLTAVHHVASAAWIGSLPFLLIFLRHASPEDGKIVTARFSRMAMASVAGLLGAGAGLSYYYVGSAGALLGTSCGVMLASKIVLTGFLLALGSLNFRIVRAIRRGMSTDALPLRRYAEAEVVIGFTILLAAASLTSTPPATDVEADRVTAPEIWARISPGWPRLQTPAFSDLSPATPLQDTDGTSGPASFVPGQVRQLNSPADIAWSEYNHHWAGLVVMAIGVVSIFAVRFRWARSWPLLFLGLALFLLIRADSENWPLGPRGFWESFQVAEVAQHRIFVLLITAFAGFEWCVQNGRLSPTRAGLVFPAVCAAGGALLLTHSHSLGNIKEEFLAELSHLPLAILAVIAGCSRWLELRLPNGHYLPVFRRIWPACFLLIGALLLNYREA